MKAKKDIDECSWFASFLTLLLDRFGLIIISTNILSTYYAPGIILVLYVY